MSSVVDIRPFEDPDLEAIVEFSLRAWEPEHESLREVLGDSIFTCPRDVRGERLRGASERQVPQAPRRLDLSSPASTPRESSAAPTQKPIPAARSELKWMAIPAAMTGIDRPK
jgi:hypothetical protein